MSSHRWNWRPASDAQPADFVCACGLGVNHPAHSQEASFAAGMGEGLAKARKQVV
jgi:hypothetical protein